MISPSSADTISFAKYGPFFLTAQSITCVSVPKDGTRVFLVLCCLLHCWHQQPLHTLQQVKTKEPQQLRINYLYFPLVTVTRMHAVCLRRQEESKESTAAKWMYVGKSVLSNNSIVFIMSVPSNWLCFYPFFFSHCIHILTHFPQLNTSIRM